MTSPSITCGSVGTNAVVTDSCASGCVVDSSGCSSVVASVHSAFSSALVCISGSLPVYEEQYCYRSPVTCYNFGTKVVPLLNNIHTEGFDPSNTVTSISGFPS